MQVYRMSYENQPLNVLLTDGLTCPFHPSAYRGSGAEERLIIVMGAQDILCQVFTGIDARRRGLLRLDNVEKLEELWCPKCKVK